MAIAQAVVAQLLDVHLGLDDDFSSNSDTFNEFASIRSYRDLYQFPQLAAMREKTALLHAAEATFCTGVIMDVLLFLSHTLAPAVFAAEIARTPVALEHWINYASEQCVVTHTIVSLDTLHGVLELYATTKRYDDLATLLLSLIFKEQDIKDSLKIAREVAGILKHYRSRLPAWIPELLAEHVDLAHLQIETEARDAHVAPLECTESGYLDKRARGASNMQANWRMRYFELTPTDLGYYKHDANKLAQSKNPFLDKRKKGNITLTPDLTVTPYDYVGKVSMRPHCIKVGDGQYALYIDAVTREAQTQWIAAISANIRRLAMDPIWRIYPRRSVDRMTLTEFLRYCMLYHPNDTLDAQAALIKPAALQDRFQIDPKRYLYNHLLNCGLRRNWTQIEEHMRPVKSNPLLPASFTSDPAFIGFGAILDIAIQAHAPPDLVIPLEALYVKHDAKHSSRVWSYRQKVDENASDAIRITIPESVRHLSQS